MPALGHDDAVQLCTRVYSGLPVGAGPCHTLAGSESNSNSTEMTYGEMTLVGMGALHDALQLDSEDVVYDLGSGVGKFILYAALRGVCASCTGVEVGVKRHATAEKAATRLEEILSKQPDGGQGSARFSAVLGDIRQPIYRDATVICLCNIMFGGALNACILANVLSRCPACSTVASIVQLHHPRLRKRKVVNVGCTWASKGVSWTIYTVLPPILRAVRHVRHNLRVTPPAAVPWKRPLPHGAAESGWAWKSRPGTSNDATARLRARFHERAVCMSRPSTSMGPTIARTRVALAQAIAKGAGEAQS